VGRELNALKDAAINSNKLRKAAGKPRQGPISIKDKHVEHMQYRKAIREGQKTKHDQIYKRFTRGTLG